jgi:metallo-beta-lactamase family protein
MKISFYGAAREVTGSNILVEVAGKKILFDCGMFQGFKLAEERNYADFAYNPREIDACVVCHAHLDHVGRLPKLYKDGFRGRIYSTAPTRELANLVLEDTEKLMREESEKDNHPPLYSIDHVVGVMSLFDSVEYDREFEVFPGVFLTLKNAGHILGSSIAVVRGDGKTLAYTSDLGNNPSILLESPEFVTKADYVICESTYGGRIHEDINKRREKLAAVINRTIEQNGVLLIPSFAIERTQELLNDIDAFCSISGCEKPTFYLDSPLALKVTGVFKKYPTYLKADIAKEYKDGDLFGLDRIHQTLSASESKQIEKSPNPKIIIAGSGMMNGGRILHHALRYLVDENCSLLFVGYQAQGTLGRRLFEGDDDVRIFGKDVHVNAQIKSIGSYSAHADMPQLVNWISKVNQLKEVFLVHGETEQSLILAKELETKLKIKVNIPQINEGYDL